VPIESGRADPELLDAPCAGGSAPLMLRRTKDAVATELPPKIEQVLTVPLQRRSTGRIYDTHLQRERQRILGLHRRHRRNRIAILRRADPLLRQLSPGPPPRRRARRPAERSARPRSTRLVEQLARGGRRRATGALVFSQFTGFLAKVVRVRLDAEGIGHDHTSTARTRQPGRAGSPQFKRRRTTPVFLISLKAGGFGLNLTEADYVFVLDPWWNPAVEAQAVDRTHRIGQDKTGDRLPDTCRRGHDRGEGRGPAGAQARALRQGGRRGRGPVCLTDRRRPARAPRPLRADASRRRAN
jgi:hypothetical protein